MNLFLYGLTFACALVSTTFFFRFWKRTKDALFLYFALCFAVLSIERLVLALLPADKEYKFYFIRLGAFLLLILAIVQKNRKSR